MLVGASRSETADPTVIRARTVEARDFLLKDEHGRVRARLSVYPTEVTVHGKVFHMQAEKVIPGQAALQFFDENGEEVWAEPKQPTLEQIRQKSDFALNHSCHTQQAWYVIGNLGNRTASLYASAKNPYRNRPRKSLHCSSRLTSFPSAKKNCF